MQGFILKIAYKGTAYCGWQVQPNKPTVQSTLQGAIESAFGTKIELTGCSRTDSGVHAHGFVALARGELPDLPPEAFVMAVNTKLPCDISVLEAKQAHDSFHPRYDAKGKEYIYTIHNSRIRDPFSEDTAWHFPRRIDEELANELCREFVGRQDFAAFMAAGSKITDTVREIGYFECNRFGDKVVFTVAADGFLYNMVRIMVGTVVEKASGSDIMPIKDIILSKDRSNAGITAPAKGLALNKVFY